MTDAGAALLGELRALTSLDLGRTAVRGDEASLGAIRALRQLRALHMPYCEAAYIREVLPGLQMPYC